ncbi:hypothetical protein DICPUDRAFT_148629 [Dictyostelium purpureum]|uniref:Uncharacterized protein n=1 Tax=Dictyostelium purpureum TaxID=5786 RepID=F0ZBL3_DICPU|nr:uncharacterized protein DICPUDRAFT_148629 [Dictyostelium purpureum]EGC38688.1 hypothetical protein DICPUDRAFT_148629 [Dictyostelium purpureum]|eukprot:XP_003284784.1 hypothetical protein DICPUDRAFT_148629 [Dictyostelium purpureum]
MFDLDSLVIVFFIFFYSVFNSLITIIILKYYYCPQQQNNNGRMFTKEDVDHLLENQKNEILKNFSNEKAILSKENEDIQFKLEKKQNKISKLNGLVSDLNNIMKDVLGKPLSVPETTKLKNALEENEKLKKEMFEVEQKNSQLNNEVQVQIKKFNALKGHAQSRLENASEQLSEIKKVAKKEILELSLKLKDSESKLALKNKQYDDMAKSREEFFSKAPIDNNKESSKESH